MADLSEAALRRHLALDAQRTPGELLTEYNGTPYAVLMLPKPTHGQPEMRSEDAAAIASAVNLAGPLCEEVLRLRAAVQNAKLAMKFIGSPEDEVSKLRNAIEEMP